MPDIRDLLDEVTTRTPPADPVTAVRRRIRSRARVRHAGTAAGAALVLAAAGTLAAATNDRTPAATVTTPPPTGSWIRLDTSWRRTPRGGVVRAENDHAYDNLVALIAAHTDVFYGFTTTRHGVDTTYTVALSAGVPVNEWRGRVAAATRGSHANLVNCPRTAVHYDEVVGDVLAADWPSGDHLRENSLFDYWGVSYAVNCVVDAQLSAATPAPEDVAYAHARWGADVRVLGTGADGGPATPAP
jgi:hypothetical protein